MRILIVDDEVDLLVPLKKHLEEACYVVDTAKDGEMGVRLAHINEYDLIILDNQMPKKTGLEACHDLRLAKFTMPILILSVAAETNIKVCALDAGADDYLTKPFSLNELLARMRALLRRPQEVRTDILTAAGITLDIARHQVVQDGREISLTKKEFMLLTYFMQNEGIVLTRGMIMEHVWDMNADPFSNTIESHVLSLRKKIHDTDRVAFIKTVPGCGYRFQATSD